MRTSLILSLALSVMTARHAISQEVTWTEVRFHRVHLINGNFLDGKLIRNDPQSVRLALPAGEVAVRRDQIDRVELVKMRTLSEKPRIVIAPPLQPRSESRAAKAGSLTANQMEMGLMPVPFEIRIEALLRNSRKGDDKGPERIRKSLLDLGHEAAPFMARLLGSVKPEDLEDLRYVLMQMKAREAVPELRALADSTRKEVRSGVASILGTLGEAGSVPELTALLADPEPVVRSSTVGALASIGDRRSFDDIVPLLADQDPSVRSIAAGALMDLSAKHGRKSDLSRALKETLWSSRAEVRAEVLSAIGKTGCPELWELVVPSLSDAEPDVRARAATALALLRAAESAEVVLASLGSERDYWPRVQLAEAAKALNLKKALPVLMDWLSETDENIRMVASRALRGISGQNFGLNRERWLAWWAQAQLRD